MRLKGLGFKDYAAFGEKGFKTIAKTVIYEICSHNLLPKPAQEAEKKAEAQQIATNLLYKPAPRSRKESGSTANSDKSAFQACAQKQKRERKHSK